MADMVFNIEAKTPWGGRGQALGMGGGASCTGEHWGKQTRLFLRQGGLARRMPANWRTHCPHERGVRISSEYDSEAAVRNTTPHCATFYSAPKRLTGEECRRDQNKCGSEERTTKCTMCVVCSNGEHSRVPTRRCCVLHLPLFAGSTFGGAVAIARSQVI